MAKSIDDVYGGGDYLKADDLGDKKPVVTIKSCKLKTFDDDETKVIVYFEKPSGRGLVLNKTNANTIAEITGTKNFDDWNGWQIQLIKAMVDFQGKRVPAIRVQAPPEDRTQPRKAASDFPDDDEPAPRRKSNGKDIAPSEDDIPF